MRATYLIINDDWTGEWNWMWERTKKENEWEEDQMKGSGKPWITNAFHIAKTRQWMNRKSSKTHHINAGFYKLMQIE